MAVEDKSERMSPFKELPRPRQPQLEREKPKASEGKEIVIRLRPWKMVKGLLVLVVLLGVFFAGRLTASDDVSLLPDFSTYFSQDAGPSGLATGDTKGAEEAEEPEAAKEEAPTEEAPVEQNETQLAESGNETAEAAKGPETVVDEGYSQVTLSLDGVYKDWKGTWGKIKGVKYTVTNKEKGTIKPHHFSMIIEGYEDGEKHFDVGIASQRIKSEETVSDEAAVSGGFAYSPVTIPDSDLYHVRISLFLLDAGGETIAAVHREVDLSGN